LFASLLARDPLGTPLRIADASVEGEGQLQLCPGEVAALRIGGTEEGAVQRARLIVSDAADDLDAVASKDLRAATGRRRVCRGKDDPSNSGCGDRRGAGARLAVMGAGFEADVKAGATSQISRIADRLDFGMRHTVPGMPTPTDDLSMPYDH